MKIHCNIVAVPLSKIICCAGSHNFAIPLDNIIKLTYTSVAPLGNITTRSGIGVAAPLCNIIIKTNIGIAAPFSKIRRCTGNSSVAAPLRAMGTRVGVNELCD